MSAKRFASQVKHGARVGLASLVMLQMSLAGPMAGSAQAKEHDGEEHSRARTPIKYVIVIVGENRTFDHLFATYEPKDGEKVDNLLSKHIIKEDGTPGKNFAAAYQYAADATDSATFQLAPKKKTLFSPLPAELNGGPSDVCADNGICSLADAMSSENGLPQDFYTFLTTGGSGLGSKKVPDSRITGVHNSAPYSTLPPGPFQLTNTKTAGTFTDDSYAASPVHRFYQMWQQFDCDASHISKAYPSGCLADLFTWTEVTVGSNNNGKPAPTPTGFDTDYSPTAHTTGEGATAMGFYNMAQGDAQYTKFLADHYAMSDNYHQPAMGGTGMDEIMLFFGDDIWFSNPDGTPGVPPHNQTVWAGGPVDEIENPNPVPGTNNFWIQDGYGGFGKNGASTGVYGGGSYTNCSDASQPGVASILNYLSSLPQPIEPNCDAGHYYLLNNYNPGYFGDGSNAYTDTNPNNTPFTIPPTSQRSIGDVLLENHVSWKSYSDQWNQYAGLNGFPGDKYQLNYGTVGPNSDQYCNICNGFHYQTQIMANDKVRTEHIKDTTDLYADIASGDLPAVSFVKPSGWVDGHPASSKWNLYEGFVKKIVDAVQSNKKLWESTAIIVTTDEGGGYYDSGYVQPLDFFGDGTRIPLIVVSKFTKPGHISHQYADHVSVLKFIERNWNLPTVSGRSRDNLPNPKTDGENLYAPTNTPAIGDLFDLFDFGGGEHDRR
jgi:phospholipase C